MLISDFYKIGNKLNNIRRRYGMTQADLAAAAGISERTYANIERGSSNMRMETLIRICNTLHITPNDLLTEDAQPMLVKQDELFNKLKLCTPQAKETALKLLATYLSSLESD